MKLTRTIEIANAVTGGKADAKIHFFLKFKGILKSTVHGSHNCRKSPILII